MKKYILIDVFERNINPPVFYNTSREAFRSMVTKSR